MRVGGSFSLTCNQALVLHEKRSMEGSATLREKEARKRWVFKGGAACRSC